MSVLKDARGENHKKRNVQFWPGTVPESRHGSQWMSEVWNLTHAPCSWTLHYYENDMKVDLTPKFVSLYHVRHVPADHNRYLPGSIPPHVTGEGHRPVAHPARICYPFPGPLFRGTGRDLSSAYCQLFEVTKTRDAGVKEESCSGSVKANFTILSLTPSLFRKSLSIFGDAIGHTLYITE